MIPPQYQAFPMPSCDQLNAYLLANRDQLIGTPMVSGVLLDPERDWDVSRYAAGVTMMGAIQRGETPVSVGDFMPQNPPLFMPDAFWDAVAAQRAQYPPFCARRWVSYVDKVNESRYQRASRVRPGAPI